MQAKAHSGLGASLPADSSAAANDRYIELLRAQPPYARLAQAMALTRMTRNLAVAGIRRAARK